MCYLLGTCFSLQPVNGSPVFEKISKKFLCLKRGCAASIAASINIWTDSVVYDELIINERQKKDENFSIMLGGVRRGALTEETLYTLEKRVINFSVPDIFSELQKEGKVRVCLFLTRKKCDQLNEQMLAQFDSPNKEHFCSDKVDETKSSNI